MATLASLSKSVGRELKAFERAELRLESLALCTTAKALHASLRYSAPVTPPRPSGALPAEVDLGVRMHESLANHESELNLGGFSFTLNELSKVRLQVTRGLIRDGRRNAEAQTGVQNLEKLFADLAGKPVTITFAKKAPLTVAL